MVISFYFQKWFYSIHICFDRVFGNSKWDFHGSPAFWNTLICWLEVKNRQTITYTCVASGLCLSKIWTESRVDLLGKMIWGRICTVFGFVYLRISMDTPLYIWFDLTYCVYIRQTKVPTPIWAPRPNFLYVFTHIMWVVFGQKFYWFMPGLGSWLYWYFAFEEGISRCFKGASQSN